MEWNRYQCCGEESMEYASEGLWRCAGCGRVYDLDADVDIEDEIDPYDMADIPSRDYDDDEPF